jgi:hypothetical protein
LLGQSATTMERIIELEDVAVVAETDTGIVCRIGAREVEVPRLLVQPGSEVWERGDRGSLFVPLWLASELGVAPGPAPSAAVPVGGRPR